jgi:hypothetical protein
MEAQSRQPQSPKLPSSYRGAAVQWGSYCGPSRLSIGEELYFAVRTNIHGLMPYISKFVDDLEPHGFCICLGLNGLLLLA